MALRKTITQDDGIVTNYHRIQFIRITTNAQNSIAVLSYIDDESRNKSKTGESRPYCKAVTYETAYDESMTIEKAYDYLKTLPEFEGAENI